MITPDTVDAQPAFLSLSVSNPSLLLCTGDWTLVHSHQLAKATSELMARQPELTTVDAEGITALDSTGALLLARLMTELRVQQPAVQLVGLSEVQQSFYNRMQAITEKIGTLPTPPAIGFLYRIGLWSVDKYIQVYNFLTFTGEVMIALYKAIRSPVRLQWRGIGVAIDQAGYQAVPILALLAFLIGVVMGYQLGEQLRAYGADVFIVNVTGVAIFREFAPLITAILLAGRTSTAFAALIGTMKVNEEIDALKTMGISPIERLVLPRVLGLLIVFPLLTVWADFFGVMGGMVMAKSVLGITFYSFLERFQTVIGSTEFIMGLVKAPVFALILAGVGCFQGFQVAGDAESVGRKTTKSAVQAIFLIIVADAGFSILFNSLGW